MKGRYRWLLLLLGGLLTVMCLVTRYIFDLDIGGWAFTTMLLGIGTMSVAASFSADAAALAASWKKHRGFLTGTMVAGYICCIFLYVYLILLRQDWCALRSSCGIVDFQVVGLICSLLAIGICGGYALDAKFISWERLRNYSADALVWLVALWLAGITTELVAFGVPYFTEVDFGRQHLVVIGTGAILLAVALWCSFNWENFNQRYGNEISAGISGYACSLLLMIAYVSMRSGSPLPYVDAGIALVFWAIPMGFIAIAWWEDKVLGK
jgi:hypothetical protein